ncbi:MAG TPA: DUF3035 domain-containing protein [Alphaproteobacteria bacterium]|jgi:hypothetical protein
MRAFRVLTVAATTLLLAGCNAGADIAQIMGNGPNVETTPVKGPPLTVPPDYNLRPPRGGGERTKAAEASRRARTAMFSAAATEATAGRDAAGRTAGEAALLRRAAAGQTPDPMIRARVNAETEVDQEEEKTFVDKLVKYKDNDDSEGSGSGVSANPKPTIKRQGEIF